MAKWLPPDPKSEGGNHLRVEITGNRIEIWPRAQLNYDPKPGRPIPPENQR
jgi:hypothetical protein